MSALPPIRLTKEKGVVPAEQPVPTQTEEERRQQEAQEYLRDHPPRVKQQTPEEIEAMREQALAAIPHSLGVPIPEVSGVTEEQLRNNPSNYKPAMEQTIAALVPTVSNETIVQRVLQENPSVLTEAAQPAVKAPVVERDERQQWVCVQGDGIRTVTDKEPHPIFGSDAHLMDQLVRCPVCNSISVRKVMPGEDPNHYRDADASKKDLDRLRLTRDA